MGAEASFADPARFISTLATRTLALLETEYPNSLRLDLRSAPTGTITPRALHPAFYGCYDWHSAVHSQWQVVRAMRREPDAAFVPTATEVLDRLLNPTTIAVETDWLSERPRFEMPYGMAWLLALARELRDWDDDRARRWTVALHPLEGHAVAQFRSYCSAMTAPVRGGLHNQSAFSLGLAWDSVEGLRGSIADAALRFYGGDTDVDLRYEPSASDFLSPALAEADLMGRVLPAEEFARWLERFAPHGFDALRPVGVVDPSDGQLAHWAGLNLSRSWMMRGIADALPAGHDLIDGLGDGADAHATDGLATADHSDIMISHWVPTFAVYLLTGGPHSPSP